MRMAPSSSRVICLLAIVAIASCGCARSPAPRFYALNSIQEGQDLSWRQSPVKDPVIGIGPVKIADYLDESQIVIRTSDNQLAKNEFNRWVGPFKDNFINVLADDIGFLLSTERIYLYPWRNSVPIDYQVTVEVVRCDGRLSDATALETRWSVFRGPEIRLLKAGRSSITEPVKGQDYSALVAAQSRAVAKFSQQIAAVIKQAGND